MSEDITDVEFFDLEEVGPVTAPPEEFDCEADEPKPEDVDG